MSTVFFRFFRRRERKFATAPKLDQLSGHTQGDLRRSLTAQGQPHRQDHALQLGLGKALPRQGGAEKGALLPAAQDPKKGGLCRQNRPEARWARSRQRTASARGNRSGRA